MTGLKIGNTEYDLLANLIPIIFFVFLICASVYMAANDIDSGKVITIVVSLLSVLAGAGLLVSHKLGKEVEPTITLPQSEISTIVVEQPKQ